MSARSPRVFVGTEGFPSTVYDAQVGDLLRVLDRAGLPFEAIHFDPFYPQTLLRRTDRARVARLRAATPGRFRHLPYVPFEDRVGAPVALRQLARAVHPGARVIHARGLWAAWLACRLKARRPGLRVVYDVRGDVWAEHAFHHTGDGSARTPAVRRGLRRIQRAEAAVAQGCDHALVVSRALAQTLARRHPSLAGKQTVIPCAYDPARFGWSAERRREWRARLGVGDAFTLVYCGSLVAYQLPEALAAVARAARPARWVLATAQVEQGRALCRAAGVEDAWVGRVDPEDVAGVLCAGDAGLLLRRADPVNVAASPTKLAEYAACGLGAVVSRGVGDAEAWVAEGGLGVLVDDPFDEGAVARAALGVDGSEAARARRAAWARAHVARDRFVEVYRRIYAGLEDG